MNVSQDSSASCTRWRHSKSNLTHCATWCQTDQISSQPVHLPSYRPYTKAAVMQSWSRPPSVGSKWKYQAKVIPATQ